MHLFIKSLINVCIYLLIHVYTSLSWIHKRLEKSGKYRNVDQTKCYLFIYLFSVKKPGNVEKK